MTLSQTYISRKQLLVDNLVAKGVTGYTVNDGLTTLINAVLEIQGGGGVRTLTLTSDKDILSYYDSDTATLSATLLEDGEPVPNVSVEFWSGSVSLGTSVTNSSGVAEKVYSSSGVGDVELSASVGTLVSETYEVEDCIRYWESVSGVVTINYSLPSEFQLDFTIYSTNILIDPSVAFFRFQSSSGIFIGKGSSNSANVQFFGSVFNQITETNTDYNYSMTYSNGVATLTDGTTTKTSTITLTKLYLLNSQGDSQLKNLKIKPL